MQHRNKHPRGLSLCGSSIDARLEEPVPLRIQKRQEREGADLTSGRSSRNTSSSSVRQFFANSGPLTIMKRRGRQNRPSVLEYMEATEYNGSAERILSSNAQMSIGFDGSERRQHSMAGRQAAKSQSLIVRKARQRRSSIASVLRDVFSQGRGPSAPMPNKQWRNDSLQTMESSGPSPEHMARHMSPVVRQLSGGPEQGYYVLSPCVSVTPDVSSLKEGQHTVWAVVEVAGRLSRVPARGSESPDTATGAFVEHRLDRYFEFGCLYDLTVEISPAAGTSVIQILSEQDFPTTIYAGSSILILVEIRIDNPRVSYLRHGGHVRQRSDELMEDLELQLGDLHTNYMQIDVSYAHSAFPQHVDSSYLVSGVSLLQSTMQTTAVATLKQCNSVSPWSPRPPPLPNTLFRLIAQHWGCEKATDAMRKMLAQRSTPRKPAKGSSDTLSEKVLAVPLTTNSPTPQPDNASLEGCIREQLDGSSELWNQPSGDALSPTSTTSIHTASSMMDDEQQLLQPVLGVSSSGMTGLTHDSDRYRAESSETSWADERPVAMNSFRQLLPTLPNGESMSSSNGGSISVIGEVVRAKKKELSKLGWRSWF